MPFLDATQVLVHTEEIYPHRFLNSFAKLNTFYIGVNSRLYQNQALTRKGVVYGRPLEDCDVGAPTHDDFADSSNKTKESYAVFFETDNTTILTTFNI